MANKVTYLIQLKDKFSAVGSKFSRQFRDVEQSADRANQKLKEFEARNERLRALSGKMARAGAVMSAAITAPVVMMGRSMIKAASDAEETQNKFNEVFKGINAEANTAAKSLASGYQLAGSTSQELLSNTGDLLVGMGLTRKQALGLSQDVVRLSADVASFKNVQGGTARAANALTKALLGEREMLKETFKVAILEEDVKARAAIIKRKDRKLTEQQAKIMATLALVTERNTDAIGDLARTSDAYANVSRANAEATKELSENFGTLLLPFATKLQGVLAKVVGGLNNLSPAMKNTILIVGGLLAIGGPLLLLLSGIAIAFTVISTPVLLVSAAILGVIAAVTALALYWDDITSTMTAQWAKFKDSLGISLIANSLKALSNPAGFITEKLGFGGSPDTPTTPVNGANNTLNGQITVSAEKGSKVERTKLEGRGPMMNVGMNMAGAY